MSDQSLRSGLIRLAHAKPELRPVLLPLLTKQAATSEWANKSGAKGKGVPNHLKKDVETFIEDFDSRIGHWDKFYRDTKGLPHAKKMVEALKKGDFDEAQKHAEALDKTDPGIVNNSMWAVFKDRRSNLPKSATARRAEYGMKPTESELQSMQEIIHVWGKALAAALGGHASVVEQSSASQIIMAVTLPDLAPNATIRAHVGLLKGEFVVGMFEWGVPSFVKEALGRDWLEGYRYSGTPEEVMRAAARTAKEVARTLEPMREQAGLRRDADAVFGQVMPKLHAWVQKALSPLAAGPMRVSGGSGADITGQGVPYAKGTLYVSGLISRADAKDKNYAEMVLEKANEALARALPHFNHDGVVAALAPERASWTADLYQVRVVLYFKKSPVRLAAGQPNYADLTKRLTLLLNSMTPSFKEMETGTMQVLQAWATANGLDVRHNLKEIAEDLLYAATVPGKPSVDGRMVERVMRKDYASAFTSRVAAAGIPVTLKKKLSLKDGTVIEAGEKGTLRFNEQTPRQAVVDFDVRPNTKLGCRLLGDYFGRPFMKEPSMSALENMGDGIAKSVTGKKVEPDGYGPDGSPSWLLVLGMI